MTLHIFNPEHDIALAANLENFTAPHAGRQLRHDLAHLPELWAEEGDAVLVDDELVSAQEECNIAQVTRIEPWGWDLALRAQLLRKGFPEALLPTKAQIETIRQLSHRRVAATTLQEVCKDETGVIGEAYECQSEEEVARLIETFGKVVLKAPWSSSGRGIRFVADRSSQQGWLRNLLSRQGSVMVEPFYNKVKDFGMEFYSDGKGDVSYLGLSLFHTKNGAYTGNILATENAKREMISRYIPTGLLDTISQKLCAVLGATFQHRYEGPFGVDMMVVAQHDLPDAPSFPSPSFLLHPCVEINLRRTMGHVALALAQRVNPQQDDEVVRVMRIVYDKNNYKLKVQRL